MKIFVIFPFNDKQKRGIMFLPFFKFPASFGKNGPKKVAVGHNGLKLCTKQ
jgi:hypothetical protein